MARFELEPLSGILGAELVGLDLGAGFEEETVAEIRAALLEHHVLVLRDQDLGRDEQLRLAGFLGKPEIHPIADGMQEHPEIIRVAKPAGESAFFGTSWHSDNSFFEQPSAITILYGETIPPYGGDTVFACMETAYRTLSEPVRAFIDPLVAVHSASRAYDPRTTGEGKYRGETAITYTFSERIYDEVEHPVVRTHPETGRRSLYVNPMFCQRIVGLHADESDAILKMLHAHATRPDFTCRVRWEPRSLTLWDNRCVQHYALDDYRAFDRVMYRVTIEGTRPV